MYDKQVERFLEKGASEEVAEAKAHNVRLKHNATFSPRREIKVKYSSVKKKNVTLKKSIRNL